MDQGLKILSIYLFYDYQTKIDFFFSGNNKADKAKAQASRRSVGSIRKKISKVSTQRPHTVKTPFH